MRAKRIALDFPGVANAVERAATYQAEIQGHTAIGEAMHDGSLPKLKLTLSKAEPTVTHIEAAR